MIKLRSRSFFRSNSKVVGSGEKSNRGDCDSGRIEWEVRPGGMLVQKRVSATDHKKMLIRVRVSTVSQFHDFSIEATSTFGEMKAVLSLMTGLQPREQRLIFKGREREDSDHLHMVGVKDGDKVLLLEDPAFKERKLQSLMVVMRQTIKV